MHYQKQAFNVASSTNIHTKSHYITFMAPFYGWGSTASWLESLRGGSLFFVTKFPEITGTHFINIGRMKG